jgi:hypothetical protein
MNGHELIGTVFMFADQFADFHNLNRVEFHRMNSPFYVGERWCVRRRGNCLNHDSEWEWEPSPSSREDEFYARCRFNTMDEAVAAYNKMEQAEKGGAR